MDFYAIEGAIAQASSRRAIEEVVTLAEVLRGSLEGILLGSNVI
jgi:hypothetical protein